MDGHDKPIGELPDGAAVMAGRRRPGPRRYARGRDPRARHRAGHWLLRRWVAVLAAGIVAALVPVTLRWFSGLSSPAPSSLSAPLSSPAPSPVAGASASLGRRGRSGPPTRGTAPPTATGRLAGTEFPPGACIAFAPLHGNRRRTVFLDPGHGGPDPGAAGTTDTGQRVEEKQLTLQLATDTARRLRSAGYRVVLSRTRDTSVTSLTPADLAGHSYSTRGKHADLLARIDCANLAHAAVLVSIHLDAYPDPSAGGTSTLYDTARPFSAADERLARLVQHETVAALSAAGRRVPDRGIVPDSAAAGGEITARGSSYGHLDILGPAAPGYLQRSTTMPGVVLEPLFITNPTEATAACDSAVQHAIATAITRAVGRFLQP